jgi:hypothetical protein
MRRSNFALLMVLISAAAVCAYGQVVPSATRSTFQVTAGALGSVFQPDYAAGFNSSSYEPIPQTSPNRLYGVGAFVDVRFSRWAQIEAEGRWLRFDEYEDISEDNYLIGPRLPIHHFAFLRATPYVKVLAGYGRMRAEVLTSSSFSSFYGRFTDIAYGGGVDFRLTRRISARGDFEYQEWPRWFTGSLYPYGASAGVSYRVFGPR